MKHIEKMIELAEAAMGNFEQNGKLRTHDEIDAVYKLMDIVKDAYCIMDMEQGYSEMGPYRSYDDGSFRGRGRDSMGRYTSRDGGSYRGYSRNDYYSGDMGEFRTRLQDLMERAPDERTRKSMKSMLDELR